MTARSIDTARLALPLTATQVGEIAKLIAALSANPPVEERVPLGSWETLEGRHLGLKVDESDAEHHTVTLILREADRWAAARLSRTLCESDIWLALRMGVEDCRASMERLPSQRNVDRRRPEEV